MLKITDNIEELRKIIKEDNFKIEEAIEFLDAIAENAEDLQNDIINLKMDLTSKEIEELESEALENSLTDVTIQCGIGVIYYKEPDNLVLQDVMENLESAIKKHTPKRVNEHLEAIL